MVWCEQVIWLEIPRESIRLGYFSASAFLSQLHNQEVCFVIFSSQWFLVALTLAAAIGIAFPSQMLALSRLPGLRSGMVACVLFLMGITVPARAFLHSFRSPLPGMLALSLNVVAVPLFAWLFASILPLPLAGGLIVAGTVPCTLASALAWTRKGGGNEVIPMMVMLVTNGLCFVIAPVTLVMLLAAASKLMPGNKSSDLVCWSCFRWQPLVCCDCGRESLLGPTGTRYRSPMPRSAAS